MLTFTHHPALHNDDGEVRRWDLQGPAGLVRFELVDAPGISGAAVHLHATTAPGGAPLENCDVCGKCWRDAMLPEHAQALRDDWQAAAYHNAVIRTRLAQWYVENLAVWAAAADQVVPAKDLPMLLAEHAPDLPYIALAQLAAALHTAGYEIVRKAATQ